MIRRPPRSTLFPTRRSSDLADEPKHLYQHPKQEVCFEAHLARSEEHTSELQSRPHLVCRLLLEKKKKITKTKIKQKKYYIQHISTHFTYTSTTISIMTYISF